MVCFAHTQPAVLLIRTKIDFSTELFVRSDAVSTSCVNCFSEKIQMIIWKLSGPPGVWSPETETTTDRSTLTDETV